MNGRILCHPFLFWLSVSQMVFVHLLVATVGGSRFLCMETDGVLQLQLQEAGLAVACVEEKVVFLLFILFSSYDD